jgi:patatin-like phospholipase/acyl hydrolase
MVGFPLLSGTLRKLTLSISCVAVYNSTASEVSLLRSRPRTTAHARADSCSITDVLLACCATPSYFNPASINGILYLNGSIGVSNPIILLLEEAKRIWNVDPDDLAGCLSIGSGKTAKIKLEAGANTLKLVNVLAQAAGDTSAAAERAANIFSATSNEEKKYFRFEVAQGLENISLNDFSLCSDVAAYTSSYLETTTVQDSMIQCTENLSERFVAETLSRVSEDDERSQDFRRLLNARKKKIEKKLARVEIERQKLKNEHSRVMVFLAKLPT